jgi:two-component system sensor histidine kinase BaeS
MEWAIALANKLEPIRAIPNLQRMIHSLAGRLTLSFLLVGVLGVLLFALLVGLRTRTEFDRFLSDRDQALLVDALRDTYAEYGTWRNVDQVLALPPLRFYSSNIALMNANGVVVFGNRDYRMGEQVDVEALTGATALLVDDEIVGYVLLLSATGGAEGPQAGGARPPLMPFEGRGAGGRSGPGEALFWERVVWAAIASGIFTILIALLLGWLLARTLTAPVRELTAATQAMAAGDLNQRVHVYAQDEIGNLALSFNQMSADLARGSQLRKQMTADLAHDLRTPLTILRGYLEGLKDAQLQGTSLLYTLMYDEVLHLQRLVDDLRILSLADAGELSLNRRLIDPAALLERTGLLYFIAAEQRGIQLRVVTTETLPSILVDTDRITQVLNNLVSNALRHTDQGEIVLSAWSQDGSVALRVSDTGSGIDVEDLPFVFDRFYRGDKSRHRPDALTESYTEGSESNFSGLGLAIAKAIVEAHGGVIKVESTPGEGTTFTLALPIPESLPVPDA